MTNVAQVTGGNPFVDNTGHQLRLKQIHNDFQQHKERPKQSCKPIGLQKSSNFRQLLTPRLLAIYA
jgi:hypothetical protein